MSGRGFGPRGHVVGPILHRDDLVIKLGFRLPTQIMTSARDGSPARVGFFSVLDIWAGFSCTHS